MPEQNVLGDTKQTRLTTPHSRIGTIKLDGKVFTITLDHGYRYIALKPISGTVTYKGDLPITADDGTTVDSTAQELTSIYELDSYNPIDNFVIDASEGIVEISILK